LPGMESKKQICHMLIVAFAAVFVSVSGSARPADVPQASDRGDAAPRPPENARYMAVVVPCEGMIDEGLYQSILRRSEEAIAMGATHIIFEIDTYGGLVKAADEISTYLILELSKNVHTVAYVKKKAISAGAMISVSCRDIIMRSSCEPIPQ